MMAETYYTAFMGNSPSEELAEGLGVQVAVLLGECDHCAHYARCSTDWTFVFPSNAACMMHRDRFLKQWGLEGKQ